MSANTITITATKPRTEEPRNGGQVGGVAKDKKTMNDEFMCTACFDVWENGFRCNMFGTRCKNCCPCAYGVTAPSDDGTCKAVEITLPKQRQDQNQRTGQFILNPENTTK